MRKFIVLLLALVLSCSMVYADSQDGEDPESQDTISVIDNYEAKKAETLDSIETLSSSIVELQETISDVKASTTSTTYTTSDIYNLLVDNFIYPAANSNSYFALSYNCFNNINAKCNTWSSYFSNINSKINTISSNLSTVKSTLNNIDTSLGGDSAITLYSLLQDDLEILINAFGGDDPATSMWSFLSSITSNTSTLSSDNTAILNALSTVNTRLNTIINSFDSINSNLTNIQDDYNNINGTVISDVSIYSTISDAINSTNSISSGSYSTFYVRVNMPDSHIPLSSFIKFTLPFNTSTYSYNSNNISIALLNSENPNISNLNYCILSNHNTYFSVLVDFNDIVNRGSGSYRIFQFNFDNNMSISSVTPYAEFYSFDSIDYHILSNTFLLRQFKDVYASDDLVQAKQEQQEFEDAAIEDFTGSGSAAASTSDLGDLKSVSTTIKSGLQSGGSVSNGLAPFSTSSGFWDWFTQSNSDNINSPSSGSEATRSVPDFYSNNSNLLRKSSNSAPDVIDFYSSNHSDLMDLFNSNSK